MVRLLSCVFAAMIFMQCRHAQISHDAVTLQGTRWGLQEMNGLPVITPENSRTAYFVMKEENGSKSIQGFAGCNSITGGYTLSEKKVRFSIASTMMMCPGKQMEIEDFFIKALTTADTYNLDGRQLTLMDGNTSLATFEAMDIK